ncbi:coatomer subunit epsilon-1 [Histomonas meleagridis]|uniref:coatomer subunit epsilon-1 n=1 Tax=Histomonas meleagridis TaxID=135588 RepID=UPI00355A9B50|nr:coatomer subunit epsilon-1 [Histomonas meleagridis]KAH0806948.1 coatomer subunit epsilon-1 [Histomonas meleagridis]
MSVDDLRENFYLGFYAKVISIGAGLPKDNEEVEFLVLRSRLAQNQIDFVLNATRSQSNNVQKGLYILATALKSGKKEEMESLLEGSDNSLIKTSQYYSICIAIINLHLSRYIEAYEALMGNTHTEAIALRIQSLLSINRPDLAEEELSSLQNTIVSTLCSAYVSLFKDKESTKNALFALLDLSEMYDPSPILTNVIAVCHFAIEEWENGRNAIQNAESLFQNDEATTINVGVALCHSEDYGKLKTQIELIKSMKNKYTSKIEEMLKDFDDTAERIKDQ